MDPRWPTNFALNPALKRGMALLDRRGAPRLNHNANHVLVCRRHHEVPSSSASRMRVVGHKACASHEAFALGASPHTHEPIDVYPAREFTDEPAPAP